MVGIDIRPPHGVPLFWPLGTEHYLSPMPLLPGINHASSADTTTSEWLASIASMHNVRAMALELALTLPLLALAELRARRGTGRAG